MPVAAEQRLAGSCDLVPLALLPVDSRLVRVTDDSGSRYGKNEGLIVACLDTSAAARPVLEAALRMGEATGRPVEAIHVRADLDQPMDTIESLAARSGVELKVLEPPLESALVDRLECDDVAVGVLGARSISSGRRPVGTVTRHLIERCRRPLLVVPPDVLSPPAFRRAVVPLENGQETSRPVAETVVPLLGEQVEVVVLHVFTEKTLPAMLDRPVRDMVMLGEQFLAKHLPSAEHIEMHVGPVATKVAQVCKSHHADLVVLSWSQTTLAGRARTVMDVLAGSAVPVLLVPYARASTEPD